MNIKIRTHHKDITSTLKEYSRKKLEKLIKFSDDIQEINAELDFLAAVNENDRQQIVVTIKLKGNTIRAKESSKDMYASIDLIFEKLCIQLRKHKEKMKDHKKSGNKKGITGKLAPKRKQPSISRISEEELYKPKPIGPEDAANIITEKSLPFLVFRNLENEKINVLYPISKNQFGLIQP
ncbi:ribosome hibernation-promoting factor, HPF/YfiA family [Candidatus Margulisiibacteriota bacterium]